MRFKRLGIAELFDAVSHIGSMERQKPAPDLFLHAANQSGLQPNECVLVEDAAAGIEAGKAGGFHALRLGPRERVENTEIIMNSLEDARLDEIVNLFDQ